MTGTERGALLGTLADGGGFWPLHADDLQALHQAVQLYAAALSRRDGGIPAGVAVLLATLSRVVASDKVRSRLPSAEVLGSYGSSEEVLSASVAVMEIDEVAALLGCGPRNVRDLVHRRTLPAQKRGGRWTFAPLDVVELLESRRSA